MGEGWACVYLHVHGGVGGEIVPVCVSKKGGRGGGRVGDFALGGPIPLGVLHIIMSDIKRARENINERRPGGVGKGKENEIP